MDVESSTELVLKTILTDLDRSGAVVEVGLGSLNYSFQWAAPRGFRCLAVEPLPTSQLREAAAKYGVPILELAMSAESGEAPIYHGRLDGFDLPDISSLNPQWWGVSDQYTIVPTSTLIDFCRAQEVHEIALLKVDTEGSEADILSCLPDLPESNRPRLLMIEYGGGGVPRSSGTGGWAPEFQGKLMALLGNLESLHYRAVIVFEESNLVPVLHTGADAFDSDLLFPAAAQVGNLVFVRDASCVAIAAVALADLRQRLIRAGLAHAWLALGRAVDRQSRRFRSKVKGFIRGNR